MNKYITLHTLNGVLTSYWNVNLYHTFLKIKPFYFGYLISNLLIKNKARVNIEVKLSVLMKGLTYV